MVQIVPGAYFTGNIARVTAYEKVSEEFEIKRGEKIANMILFLAACGLFQGKGQGPQALEIFEYGEGEMGKEET
jgi:hypothetical protein